MLRLKPRRKPTPDEVEREGWPVVDGARVPPYELPRDHPRHTQAKLRQMEMRERRVAELERTSFSRAMSGVVERLQRLKGRGFDVTVWRYTLEFHRKPTGGGEKFRLEFYRRLHWDFTVELWKSL